MLVNSERNYCYCEERDWSFRSVLTAFLFCQHTFQKTVQLHVVVFLLLLRCLLHSWTWCLWHWNRYLRSANNNILQTRQTTKNPAQFSSVQSLDWLGHQVEHQGQFSRDSLPVFSAGGSCEQFCHRQGCPLFDIVHPAFPLLTTALPTLQGVLKNGF